MRKPSLIEKSWAVWPTEWVSSKHLVLRGDLAEPLGDAAPVAIQLQQQRSSKQEVCSSAQTTHRTMGEDDKSYFRSLSFAIVCYIERLNLIESVTIS